MRNYHGAEFRTEAKVKQAAGVSRPACVGRYYITLYSFATLFEQSLTMSRNSSVRILRAIEGEGDAQRTEDFEVGGQHLT